MIATRYAPHAAVLLALALVPTALHSYWGATAVDGLSTAAIASTLATGESQPTPRRGEWVKKNFDSDDWIERAYRLDGHTVVLFAARSYDAKRLYHHPELALLRSVETQPAGVLRASARPDVPLHVLKTSREGVEGLSVYALLYDGRFVDNPITFQLRTAAEQMVGSRKLMTLLMASDPRGAVDQLDSAPATRILLAAIDSFESRGAAASTR